MLYDSACKTAAQVVNILKVEHTLPLRDGVCSTNAQIRDGNIYLVIRKSGTTVTPHLYSLERFFWLDNLSLAARYCFALNDSIQRM